MSLLGLPNIPSGFLPNDLTKSAAIDPPAGRRISFAEKVGSSLVCKKRHSGFVSR